MHHGALLLWGQYMVPSCSINMGGKLPDVASPRGGVKGWRGCFGPDRWPCQWLMCQSGQGSFPQGPQLLGYVEFFGGSEIGCAGFWCQRCYSVAWWMRGKFSNAFSLDCPIEYAMDEQRCQADPDHDLWASQCHFNLTNYQTLSLEKWIGGIMEWNMPPTWKTATMTGPGQSQTEAMRRIKYDRIKRSKIYRKQTTPYIRDLDE